MIEPRAVMGSACGLALLGVGLAVVSCAEVPSTAKCEAACSIASRCGLLPSALGGTVGASRRHNEDDCIARCETSDVSTQQVQDLLQLLGEAAVPQDEPLCSPNGTYACQDLIDELQDDPDTSELEITTALTVRMTSAANHVTKRSLSSWCCFDYTYELIDDDQDSTAIDEVAAIYDMIEPTHRCVTQLMSSVGDALTALNGMEPDQVKADAACGMIRATWMPQDKADECSSSDACCFARMSNRLVALGLPDVTCELDPLRALDQELFETLNAWNLEPGGWLINPLPADDTSGLSTALDVDIVRDNLNEKIHDQLTRPLGFLDEACQELQEVLGANCEQLDRTAPPEASPCETGPICSAADCLAESPACDITSCDSDDSPPGRECGALGITAIRLGYRTDQGLEILGEPITGCENLSAVVTTFEDVKAGPLTPIAIVSGTIPALFIPSYAFVTGDGAYSWIVEGDRRWVGAGEATLELPSPMLERLENAIEDPLEQLGWVYPRLPTGQDCDTNPQNCEGYFNDNCDNGIDDDGDGLIDDASPWCDRLLEEAERRCVVVAPGRAPFDACQVP